MHNAFFQYFVSFESSGKALATQDVGVPISLSDELTALETPNTRVKDGLDALAPAPSTVPRDTGIPRHHIIHESVPDSGQAVTESVLHALVNTPNAPRRLVLTGAQFFDPDVLPVTEYSGAFAASNDDVNHVLPDDVSLSALIADGVRSRSQQSAEDLTEEYAVNLHEYTVHPEHKHQVDHIRAPAPQRCRTNKTESKRKPKQQNNLNRNNLNSGAQVPNSEPCKPELSNPNRT